MFNLIFDIYVYLFARRRFEKINRMLFRLSLSGLGILNHKTNRVSGELAFLKQYLPKATGVVIDAGANRGEYTKAVIEINPRLTVYAFEPHPKTFLQLTRNLALFNTVMPVPKGLSCTCGTEKLYDYGNKDGSSHASLFQEVITEIHGSSKVAEHNVDLVTLDDFVESERIQEISLLKIDTEGNEMNILLGGCRCIEEGKIKAIHFEFNEMNVFSRNFFLDFWKLLDSYDLYRLLPNEALPIRHYTPLSCELFAFQNVVAILREKDS